jgi:hypothetical protein
MKDAHLTLRLPDALATELERVADERGVPKSMVVREAVSRYLVEPTPVATPNTLGASGAELAEFYRNRPRVSPEDAAQYERAIRETLESMPPLDDPWA